MLDPVSRIIAAVLTVIGMFLIAYVTHQLTVARERARHYGQIESGRAEKIENFSKNVHSPIIRKTGELESSIDHLWTLWNPESEIVWKKIKKEQFHELVINLRSIGALLQDILDLITPYLALLPEKLTDSISGEIPWLVRELKILETLEKEKSQKPYETFIRLKNIKPSMKLLREEFKVRTFDEFLKFCDKQAKARS